MKQITLALITLILASSAQATEPTHLSPSTIFHVASVSKQFTAYAIALLAAEGALANLRFERQEDSRWEDLR